MHDLVKVFTSAEEANPQRDDDFTDRLNSRYTVIVLVVFALVVSMHQYVGDPITCWMPQHFTGAHGKYANSYCWVRNTYYLPFDDYIPAEDDESLRDMVTYYQWVPLILLAQALLFYLPNGLWHSLNQTSGVDADSILATSQTFNSTDNADKRDDVLMIVRNQMDRFLKSRRRGGRKGDWRGGLARREISGRRFGCYLVIVYCFSKFLYLVNVVGQLFILNSILSLNYHIYGIEVFSWMMDNYDWTTSPQVAFPRVTMCDFKVRRLGNIHRYTVQCTLPINLYNEKIYMFLWFWMVFVAVVTAISLVTWILRIVSVSDRERYVQNHLKMMGKVDKQSNDLDDDTRRFVRSYLRHDGVFLLRLIGHNTNTLTVSEIIGALWENRPKHLRSGPIKSTHDEDPTDPGLPLKPGAESTA